jgi:Rad3-related DNA helicase
VILKVPWPDSREPVIEARTVKDKTYPAYIAMQDLVQAVGRGMRSEDDQCETLILDDHVRWFLSKYRTFAPQWFLDAFRSCITIPIPPPRLEQAPRRHQ